VSTIVGAIITLLNFQSYRDTNGVDFDKCEYDLEGNLVVPEDSNVSLILRVFYGILVVAVLFKVFIDCGKQIVYYELFTYGALVDFENNKPPYFAVFLGVFCGGLLFLLFKIDDDIAKSAVKQTMAVSLVSQAWGLFGKHKELRNRESNILCINRVFEQHHSLARHHLQNITVLPYRVVKLVVGKVLVQKAAGDEVLKQIEKELKLPEDQENRGQAVLDAIPDEHAELREMYGVKELEDGKTWIKFKRFTTKELYVRCMMIMESKSISLESTKGRSESFDSRPSIDDDASTYETEETLDRLNELREELPFWTRLTCIMPNVLGHIYEPLYVGRASEP